MKNTIVGAVVLSLAGTLFAAGAAFAGGGSGPAPQPGTSYVAGPQRVSDPLNHTVIEVPKGWFAAVPLRGITGATTLTNYDADRAVSLMGLKSNHVLLKEMAKVDVLTLDLGNAVTLEQWMGQRYAGNGDTGRVVTSRKVPVRIAGRQGMAAVLHLGLASSVEIVLPFSKDKVLLANIAPADTVDLAHALAAVDRVRASRETGLAKRLSPAALSRLTASLHELIANEIQQAGSIEDMSSLNKAAACTSWTGTDNGDCSTGMSCASTAGITLYLPLQYQSYWMAGGVGSFYGNYYHGNCNNDYYAIDFNHASNSSCTAWGSSSGQNVWAAASGTASVPAYDATGYGNYVIVTHSNGYKTYYAHLSSINVTNGQAVTGDLTLIGLTGDTGSASGSPHLHISYRNSSSQSRCNKTNGCPNGEAARSPQTFRPSPMVTNLGSKAMTDGGCYQGPS